MPENAMVTWPAEQSRTVTHVSDLGVGGVFINAEDPLPVGSNLTLLVRVAGRDCHIRGVVRRSIPTKGMGVEFVNMSAKDRECLTTTAESPTELHYKVLESAVSPGLLDPTPAPSDRRGHRRHDVTAQVEVVAEEPGLSVNARLGGLNHGGCYLRTESPLNAGAMLAITITKGPRSFQSRARVVCHNPREGMGVMFLDTAPEELAVLCGWLEESLERMWWSSERRRNQRVLIQVPVQITGHTGSGPFIEETQTRKIGVDGCSVMLSQQVSKAQRLMLLNRRTRAVTECMVAHIMTLPDGRYEVAMAFLLPNEKFWPVVFPPSDRSNGRDVA